VPRAALGVFAILWASYAFFWQGRDWNTASRLMLTYALVDRGTISIDGLDDQTGDKALYRDHYYSDKLPGYSMLAAGPYAAIKAVFRLPPHPLDARGFAHWPADYGITLLTSGLLTAATGSLLMMLASDLGCGPRRSVLLGLAYGLATPAYVYATLAYGHQAAAACLLGSCALIRRDPDRREAISMAGAGFLAAYAAVVEIQVGPVSAILGLYAAGLAASRRRSVIGLIAFGLGALVPTLFLLGYNLVAFGSPLRMGYFYHATQRFAAVHNAANPLGLGRPDWSRLDDLLVRPARGLLWYAPIVLLTLPGLVAMVARRMVGMAAVCAATMAAVILVNLSYPEWSGGWSTGPRLLVPLLPFAMLPVAGLLAVGGRAATTLAVLLAVAGAVVAFLFQGVGGRVPDPQPAVIPGRSDPLANPLFDAVLPIWGGGRLPGWLFGERYVRTLVSIGWPDRVESLGPSTQWVQFVPLLAFQAIMIGLLFRSVRPTGIRQEKPPEPTPSGADPTPPATPDPP